MTRSFPHILIREDHEAPQALKHRGAKKIKGQYFGPFASAGAVDHTLDTLQKAFLLRTCTDNIYATRSRPCMLHQMGRCSAPCVGIIPLDEYRDLVREAERFLNGDAETLQEQLAAQMDRAAQSMDYERAARLRDRIRALVGCAPVAEREPGRAGGSGCVRDPLRGGSFRRAGLLLPRGAELGRHTSGIPSMISDEGVEQILTAFLAQFYDDKPVPKLILLSHEIEEPDADDRSARAEGRAQGRDPHAAARREAAHCRAGATECARGAGPQAGGDAEPAEDLRGCAESVRPARAAESASRSTTTATSWARTWWAAWW